ncbi:MAG TPA: hypothetical protein DIV79_06760 [Opitutae bacterium]|nr:hypothetical protein [Opitutaceae bacterium]HCR29697.1 hypothetical protein [Opitutae bacterium]
MSACIELLQKLVAIPSVNPVYGGPGEKDVEAFVRDWLSEKGIEFHCHEVLPGRRNVVARIGAHDKPSVLIEAHMDTVGVDGWAIGSPYELQCREGKWYGRGSCDTKASLATFMLLAERCNENASELNHSLVFAASADEEAAQLGAYKLAELRDRYDIKGALTGEPTRSGIITKHKGACRYTIEAAGKAAHGSTPHLGENAIYKTARLVEKLERLAELLSQEDNRESIERGSLNVGRIAGGIGFNIVPDNCSIDLDRRLGVSEEMEEAREAIEVIAKTELGVSLSTVLERPPLNTDNQNWFPQALAQRALDFGTDADFGEAAFMTNGVAYASVGIPTVVFGPGGIEQAHKVDEYIDEGEMERSLGILESFFLS